MTLPLTNALQIVLGGLLCLLCRPGHGSSLSGAGIASGLELSLQCSGWVLAGLSRQSMATSLVVVGLEHQLLRWRLGIGKLSLVAGMGARSFCARSGSIAVRRVRGIGQVGQRHPSTRHGASRRRGSERYRCHTSVQLQ